MNQLPSADALPNTLTQCLEWALIDLRKELKKEALVSITKSLGTRLDSTNLLHAVVRQTFPEHYYWTLIEEDSPLTQKLWAILFLGQGEIETAIIQFYGANRWLAEEKAKTTSTLIIPSGKDISSYLTAMELLLKYLRARSL